MTEIPDQTEHNTSCANKCPQLKEKIFEVPRNGLKSLKKKEQK